MKRTNLRILGGVILITLFAASTAIPFRALADAVTGPSITFSGFTPNGSNGWYISSPAAGTVTADDTSNVVSLTCIDTLNSTTLVSYTGGATTSYSTALSVSGAGIHPVTCSATDGAGNTTSDVSITISIDLTAPGITYQGQSPSPNTNGWNNTNVTAIWNCTDPAPGSGPASATATTLITGEGGNLSATGTCFDVAGNSTSDTQHNIIKIDRTRPTINPAQVNPDRAPDQNGWYKAAVTYTFGGNDPSGSGIDYCSSITYSGPDNRTASISGTCTDLAGNTSLPYTVSIQYDTTSPTASLSAIGTAGDNGWYTSAITIRTTGTDNVSNVSCSADQIQATEIVTATFNGSCTDEAGWNTSATPLTIKVDLTAPSVAISASGTLGSNNWYKSDVTISLTGSDTISEPVSCMPSTQTLNTDTGSTGVDITGTCTNDAGLSTNASINIKRDTTPPIVTLVGDGTIGDHGWYTSSVTIITSGTDAASTVTCTANQAQSTETTGATFNGYCTDEAGWRTDASPLTVKVDKTAPTAVIDISGTLGSNNWYTSDVTITVTGNDSISTPVICTPSSQTLTTDTNAAGITYNGSCTNDAGLTTSATPVNIKRDTSGPSASLSASGVAGANGWYTSAVTITTTGSDPSSAVTCTGDQSQSTETTGIVFNGSCSNAAGLTTLATPLPIKVDLSAPSATIVPTGTLGTNSWYKSDVTITVTGNDTISTPVVCTPPSQTLTTDTDDTGITYNGSCTNNAGLTTTASAINVKRDATVPTIVLVDRFPAAVNGWNNTDVTVSWSCADATNPGSGIINPNISIVVSSEGAAQTATGICTDKAGNTAQKSQSNISIDKTPPTAFGAPERSPDSNGWYNHQINIIFDGSDNLSGIDHTTCTVYSYSGPDASNVSSMGTCTDAAGNISPIVRSTSINYDSTGPDASITANRTPDRNGWYNHSVMFSFSGIDGFSGMGSCSPNYTYNGPDNGAVFISGSCTDRAGNTTNTDISIQYDAGAPTGISGGPDRSPDRNGWYNHALNVVFTGTDSTSGIDTCSTYSYTGPDNTGISYSGSCMDRAGNTSGTVRSSSFKYDQTGPSASITASRSADRNGWYNHAVTFNFSGSDALSGLDSCSTDNNYSGPDGAAIAINGSCIDVAGNTSPATQTIKYDSTVPTGLSGAPDRVPDKNDWYNHAVNVVFIGTDITSGIDICSTTLYTGPDNINITVPGTCTDKAGNTSAPAISSPFKFDTTRPIAAGSVPPPNSNGWYNENVTITFTGTDALSGIDSCTAPVIVSSEGRNQSGVGMCKDRAGNVSAVASVGNLNIDKTRPAITYIGRVPPPDNSGWNSTPVTLAWSCADTLSGIAISPVTQEITTEGRNQSIEGTCLDLAGNKSFDTQSGINISFKNSSQSLGTPTASPTLTLTPPSIITLTPASGTNNGQEIRTPTPVNQGTMIDTDQPAGSNLPSAAGNQVIIYILIGLALLGLLYGLFFLFKNRRKSQDDL